jgi:hypothetical protein
MMRKTRLKKAVLPRGYSMLVTLMLLSMLAAAIGVLVQMLLASGRTSGEMVQRRENFYTCDGLSRTVTKLSQDYLVQAEAPNDVDLKAAICTAAGGCTLPTITPAGYAVSSFDVSIGDITTGPIPSGPFRDMNARQTTVAMDLRAVRTGSGFACETHQDITLAQVGLFQFFVFAEEFLDFYPGANMTAEGRIHVNGDVCIGSTATLRAETITAVGDIYAGNDLPRCRNAFPANGLQVRDKVSNTYRQMNASMDHSCTDASCGAGWTDFALARWGGNVLDSAHKVPFLRVPVTGDPPVQDGQNAAAGIANNATTQRFIIDPPATGEPAGVAEQRMAIKADIRIINGVWYKRDPDNPTVWPGTPIWSDHPGKYTTANHVGVERVAAVGQQDIIEDQGYATPPRRYSYYEYDTTTNALAEDDQGVISYGSLFRVNSNPPVWRPGFFLHSNAASPVGPPDPAGIATKHRFCAFKNTTQSWDEGDFAAADKNAPITGEYAVVDATVTGRCFACVGDAATLDNDCTDSGESLVDVGIGGQVLEAARTGFHDQRVEAAAAARGAILPVNFDVAQLAAALADTSTGELGDHFSGGASFNGIVYISYTWDNQMNGIGAAGGGALPALWPNPRSAADPAQPLHHTSHGNNVDHFADDWATTALPWPLCSGTGPVATTGGLGRTATQRFAFSKPTDAAGTPTWFEPVFTIPNCDTAGTTTRPNAIRVINSYRVHPGMFPKGLTIATNIPAYVLGDANAHSDDVIINGPGADDAEWRPMLVAADAVTLLSRAWTDARSPWTRASNLDHRDPTATRWRMALLTGNVRTTGSGGSMGNYSGGLENFPRFLERWGTGGINTMISGSLVLGFNSVYQRQRWGAGNVYSAPVRNWSYDTKLNAISNQPPGAPVYNVQAVKRWSAE